jgi:microcystin-dependent protein
MTSSILNRPLRAALVLAAPLCLTLPVQAQSEPLIGQISCAGFNFAPRQWAPLDGQLLPIAQNEALFSLLGTAYGGDGRTTFGLPDARGRVLIHQGSGPGLRPRSLGQRGGGEDSTLSGAQMPAHDHGFAPLASSTVGSSQTPQGSILAASPKAKSRFAPGPGDTTMTASTTETEGGNQAVNNMAPFVTTECFIALQGVYPSRN